MWAACLQEIQALRQGGSWQRAESDATARATAGATPRALAGAILTNAGGISDAGSDGAGAGAVTAPHLQEHIDEELNKQLDTLDTLTYPNSAIRYVTVWTGR